MTDTLATISAWLGSGSINIFGIPYAGKDTQAALLAEQLVGIRLSSGEIIRNSVIPAHVRELQDRGDLIPTQDFIDTVLPYFNKQEFAGKPLLLSSVGRWHGEEDGVMQATEQSGHPIKAVVFLNTNESVLRERWHTAQLLDSRGGRADDAEEKLATRLEEFREKTLPVINYYRNKGLLIEIDGGLTVVEVNRQLLTELEKRALAV